jgi:hypothetical protein
MAAVAVAFAASFDFSHILDIPCEVWVELMGHVSSAKDLVNLSSTCKQAQIWTNAHENSCWRSLFQQRWPGFYEALPDRSLNVNWKELAHDVYEGKKSFHVQVFNRENHAGFRMSCYDAEATYRKQDGMCDVKYLAPLDRTEVVPFERCRVVPAPYREHDPSARYDGGDHVSLKVGDNVEVQWRSTSAHPFGWWHGEVESIDGKRVKLIFKQFDKDDIFYSISFEMPGMKNMQQVEGSGTYGGFRALNPQEKAHWLQFWELKK